MCGRYYMEDSPEMQPYVKRALQSPLRERLANSLGRSLKTEGEVCPTDLAPVIAPDARTLMPTVYPMAWGFTNPRGSGAPLINDRSETAASRPFWKAAWNSRRCLIPASFYFEWEHLAASDGKKKTGDKYMIKPEESRITYLAGLYQIEERKGIKVPVFAVLTRQAGECVRFIHDRMPIILPKESAKAWVSTEGVPEEIIESAITEVRYEIYPIPISLA